MQYLLSILSGIFIGTSYIPFAPWAAIFCFVPLWLAYHKQLSLSAPQITSNRRKYIRIFTYGWLTQFIFTMIGFNWVAFTAHEFGNLPWPGALLVLILFCATAHLYVPLAGVAWAYFALKYRLSLISSVTLLALLTAILESFLVMLFPWNYGYSFYWTHLPIAQMGELIGFQGISSTIILLNIGFYLFWHQRRLKAPAKKFILIPLGIFAAFNLCGVILNKTLPKPDSMAHFLLVQANIGNMQKQQAEKGVGFREHIASKYTELSRQGVLAANSSNNKIDFVVWPETAYPYDIDQRIWSQKEPVTHYPFYAQRLIDLSRELDTHLITGGYGYSPFDDKITNTFFVVNKQTGLEPHPYYKNILLAFGEYLPGENFIPKKIRDLIPTGDFSRGSQLKVVSLPDQPKIGPQICYEGLFPNFSNRVAGMGAEIFVNLTNDSWYGTWQEPYQHLYMTLARAIEFRRPLVRATNTGISTVALASGQVLEMSPLDKEWVGYYSVPYLKDPKPTFYQLCPWLMDALLILSVLLILGKAQHARSKKS